MVLGVHSGAACFHLLSFVRFDRHQSCGLGMHEIIGPRRVSMRKQRGIEHSLEFYCNEGYEPPKQVHPTKRRISVPFNVLFDHSFRTPQFRPPLEQFLKSSANPAHTVYALVEFEKNCFGPSSIRWFVWRCWDRPHACCKPCCPLMLPGTLFFRAKKARLAVIFRRGR